MRQALNADFLHFADFAAFAERGFDGGTGSTPLLWYTTFLAASVQNLRKLAKLIPEPNPAVAS